jgi:hypothetical protein
VAGWGEANVTGFSFNLGSAANDSSIALLLGLFAQAVTETSRQIASQVFTVASIFVLLVLAGDRS